jgi:hypothetical protein
LGRHRRAQLEELAAQRRQVGVERALDDVADDVGQRLGIKPLLRLHGQTDGGVGA